MRHRNILERRAVALARPSELLTAKLPRTLNRNTLETRVAQTLCANCVPILQAWGAGDEMREAIYPRAMSRKSLWIPAWSRIYPTIAITNGHTTGAPSIEVLATMYLNGA